MLNQWYNLQFLSSKILLIDVWIFFKYLSTISHLLSNFFFINSSFLSRLFFWVKIKHALYSFSAEKKIKKIRK
jgi:hypothetical protein